MIAWCGQFATPYIPKSDLYEASLEEVGTPFCLTDSQMWPCVGPLRETAINCVYQLIYYSLHLSKELRHFLAHRYMEEQEIEGEKPGTPSSLIDSQICGQTTE